MDNKLAPLLAIDVPGTDEATNGKPDSETANEEGTNVNEEVTPEETDEIPNKPPAELTVPLDSEFKKLPLDNTPVNTLKEVNDTKEELDELPKEDSSIVLNGKIEALAIVEDKPEVDDKLNPKPNTELIPAKT